MVKMATKKGATRDDLVRFLRQRGVYEIDISFDPKMSPGTGLVAGIPTPYKVEVDQVSFMSSGKTGTYNTYVYSRRKQTFQSPHKADTHIPYESCKSIR